MLNFGGVGYILATFWRSRGVRFGGWNLAIQLVSVSFIQVEPMVFLLAFLAKKNLWTLTACNPNMGFHCKIVFLFFKVVMFWLLNFFPGVVRCCLVCSELSRINLVLGSKGRTIMEGGPLVRQDFGWSWYQEMSTNMLEFLKHVFVQSWSNINKSHWFLSMVHAHQFIG